MKGMEGGGGSLLIKVLGQLKGPELAVEPQE